MIADVAREFEIGTGRSASGSAFGTFVVQPAVTLACAKRLSRATAIRLTTPTARRSVQGALLRVVLMDFHFAVRPQAKASSRLILLRVACGPTGGHGRLGIRIVR